MVLITPSSMVQRAFTLNLPTAVAPASTVVVLVAMAHGSAVAVLIAAGPGSAEAVLDAVTPGSGVTVIIAVGDSEDTEQASSKAKHNMANRTIKRKFKRIILVCGPKGQSG